MTKETLKGHLTAVFTIFIWGTTFVSTKLLLKVLQPIEILFIRFLIGYLALWLIRPRPAKRFPWQQECYFLFAGISGIGLYYLCENIALQYTSASNIGVIVSVAPFFTAFLAMRFTKAGKPTRNFISGFLLALAGIALLSFSGSQQLNIHPLGDFLGLLAAFIWAVYSLLLQKINSFGYSTILATRKTFFYGLLVILPLLWISQPTVNLTQLLASQILLHLLYLALGASALCFVTWNYTVKVLGPVGASVYIYGVPVITIVASVLFLKETFTWAIGAGALLTTMGLIISEKNSQTAAEEKASNTTALAGQKATQENAAEES